MTRPGTPVETCALQVDDGLRLEVVAYGAAVHRLLVPTASGPRNVVLGYETLEEYVAGTTFFGATIGRYANRIAGGRFTLDGEQHVLDTNENGTTLHGGSGGFDTREWTLESHTDASLTMSMLSSDGDQGFPGSVSASVTYTVTADEVRIHLAATTDRPTVVNLTNHSYFNLDGEGSGSIDEHLLMVNADHYTPTDDLLVPTGEIAAVDLTPLDLRTPTRIGGVVRRPHPQLRAAQGIDHNLVVRGSGLREVATVASDDLRLTVSSDAPGVQVYTGNFLDGTDAGTSGLSYRQGDGLALEPQAFPDTPNRPEFGSAVLRPGERYERRIVWRLDSPTS
jgi:aldose 1-epimerase